MFSKAVLPHCPGVVYYRLLLRRETRIPGVAPFSFQIGIWDLFVHRGHKSYTPTAFGKLLTTYIMAGFFSMDNLHLARKPCLLVGDMLVNFGDILSETSKCSACWDIGVHSYLTWLSIIAVSIYRTRGWRL